MALHVIGVRHHAPACARLVRATLLARRPRHVLIEGPADFNARIGELALGHALPIAIFTHYQDHVRRVASWTPFCAYSPEWVALEVGRAVGAEVRFCDLPAWHPAFAGRHNRYGDLAGARERARSERMQRALCERAHCDDGDTLWDHLFEQAMPLEALAAALRAYFIELRGDAPGGPTDAPREALMARWAAWALHDAAAHGGARADVVVVCGGWHAPVIEAQALALFESGAGAGGASGTPAMPALDPAPHDARFGSELVPYTYKRLDAFAGYDSGMPSPQYHEWVWRGGHAHAADEAMVAVTARVRGKKQPLSTADLIGARALAEGLAALRGHAEPLRCDVLDGIAGAVVKDGLDVPFPWALRGPLAPRTEPILVEVVAALSGDRRGALAEGTPRPALCADVARELAVNDLVPGGATRAVKLSLREPAGRAKSRVLHRLRVLKVPGFERKAGPSRATDTTLDEAWAIAAPSDQETAIIEASQWGATLEGAAAARLEAALRDAGGRLSALAAILGEAVFVGVTGLEARVIDEVARAIGAEPSFAELGAAAARLLDLDLHGELLGAAGARQLEVVLAAAFDRGLWLLEGLGTGGGGASVPAGASAADDAAVHACVALRDLMLHGPPDVVAARPRADGVMQRRAVDEACPPAIRGACLGVLWSLDRLGSRADATAHAARAVRSAALPTTFGELLGGLFAAARQEVLEAPELVAVIDEVLCALGDHETMVALPSLRLAFAYFPPAERERIASRVLTLHDAEGAGKARAMVRPLALDPNDVMRGVALDREVAALAQRFGLAGDDGARTPGDGA